jgi:ABC-type lipoprotein export system ATPase subunit
LLEKPTEGEIDYLGERIDSFSEMQKEDYRNFECGFVYQHFNLLEEKTAFENVELPLLLRGNKEGTPLWRPASSSKPSILNIWKRRKPVYFPAGKKQRIAILRALVGKPRLFLRTSPQGSRFGK